jgi:hypothetical protein
MFFSDKRVAAYARRTSSTNAPRPCAPRRSKSAPDPLRLLRRHDAAAALRQSEDRRADLFYNIISRRHARRSTIVTTNLAFEQWSTVFPSAACVGALVDRFSHQCHPLDIDADSWRNKESQTFHKQPAAQGKDGDKTKKLRS